MPNPFKPKPKPYVVERDRLLENMQYLDPDSEAYETVMSRLNDIDKLINRASETRKAIIPAAGTAIAIGGIYVLQQFGGVIIPKALERIDMNREQKKHKELD